jgi:hypothetical protein
MKRPGVKFWKKQIMRGGEYDLFRAARMVTGQPMPCGQYPFHVFPQVILGEILGTEARKDYLNINGKRCDLLLTDRKGFPVAVLEYQGSGHDIDGTAEQRDDVKRLALEGAGVCFREIPKGTTQDEMQQIIRQLLTDAAPGV